MSTSTLSRRASESSPAHESRQKKRGLHTPRRIKRLQDRGAVMVHRHAFPSVAATLGLGLIAGLVAGKLLSQAIESRQAPESLLDRSRRRVGESLSNLSHIVPSRIREWRD